MCFSPDTAECDGEARHPPPERIGAFGVVRRVGAGGMGVVYEAEQTSPRRRAALEMMHPTLSSPQALERFELEAAVLARLQHPGIARVFKCGTADLGRGPQPYIAMEFVEGCDLERYCVREAAGVERKLELVALVADAVQHAHERGVVHRDLKPANVLVDARGTPVVVDFGVARASESSLDISIQTQSGQLLGTLAYMAPEQLTGAPSAVTRRVDVYALGVILHELLAGRTPRDVSGLGLAAAIALLAGSDAPRLGQLRRARRGQLALLCVGRSLGRAIAQHEPGQRALAAHARPRRRDELRGFSLHAERSALTSLLALSAHSIAVDDEALDEPSAALEAARRVLPQGYKLDVVRTAFERREVDGTYLSTGAGEYVFILGKASDSGIRPFTIRQRHELRTAGSSDPARQVQVEFRCHLAVSAL